MHANVGEPSTYARSLRACALRTACAFAGIAGFLPGNSHAARVPALQEPNPAAVQAQEHYDAAFRLQDQGQTAEADAEHKLFLGLALHHLANARANAGEYARAVPVYDEAMQVSPTDLSLYMDYAEAALDGFDWKKAKQLAGEALDRMKASGVAASPQALSVLAQALMGMGDYRGAVEQFKMAAQLEPGFRSEYALAGAYLALGDQADAATIFEGMPAKYGDTGNLHLKMGRLYGEATFYDDAIREFKAAIALDPRMAGAHFSLAATYMMRSGEPAYDLAEPELRKEIEIDAGSPLPYIALGRIEVVKHRSAAAEADLQHALELDPANTGALALLGQLYTDMGRDADAEAILRKQIALTLVPAKNDFEVQRAHFCLGRLLMKDGEVAEGRKELEISRRLLEEKTQQAEQKLKGKAILQLQVEKTREASPEELEAEQRLETQVGPMMASSYDNLAVHAAIGGDFGLAEGYFKRAAEWNPAIPNIQRNWGRAAFAAGDYNEALGPLGQALEENSDDEKVRSMLGQSLFETRNYAQAVAVLQPMEQHLGDTPGLELEYIGARAIGGGDAGALDQLKAMTVKHPEEAEVHRLLGEAYGSRKQYAPALKELKIALRLEPGSEKCQYALAMAELAAGNKSAAQKSLADLVKKGSKDGDVHYQLGLLLMDQGKLKEAEERIAEAVNLRPANAAYRTALGEATKKGGALQEAEGNGRSGLEAGRGKDGASSATSKEPKR